MTFKSRIWQPVAIGLSAVNLVAVGFAASGAEPWHAAVHSVLALAFGLGAERLRQRRVTAGGDLDSGLEALELDVSELRRELTEVQERLDFTERMLTQGAEARRTDAEH